jgi:integrase
MTDLWSESRGDRPCTVWVGERVEKGLTVYLRWYEGRKTRWKRAEVASVRDARGRLRATKVREAVEEADQKVLELKGEAPTRSARRGPLTLGEGVRLAFSQRGPYPLPPAADQYTGQTLAYAEAAVRHLGGPDATWEGVTPGMIRSVWRKVYEAEGGAGANKATKVVGAIYRIARWLEGEMPEGRFPRPIPGWRNEVAEHWKRMGREIQPHRPAYDEEEADRLFRARGTADPRLVLALALGAELRGGQVIQTHRSHCDLEGEVWRVQIPFASKRKRAPRLALSPSERAALEYALTQGYLAELEVAYTRGELEDYALFGGGKLRNGRVPVERSAVAMDPSSLRRMLRELERDAGVEHIRGRGWHGLRRLFADLYERVDDDRVKDRLGGWTAGSEMRRAIYQRQEDESLDVAASEAREQLRPGRNG